MKTIDHPDYGTVRIRKIKRSQHVRVRIQPNGDVLLTLPTYVSQQAGLAYLDKQAEWIAQNRIEKPVYRTGDRVGSSYSFAFAAQPISKVQTRRGATKLIVRYPRSLTVEHSAVQTAAHDLAHRALKHEAETHLPGRLERLAHLYGFTYADLRFKKLRSRWGSCSSHKEITLNIFLTQLPDDLVEYVLLHELTHTKHMNHSAAFWTELEHILPDAKQRRKRLQNYRPSL